MNDAEESIAKYTRIRNYLDLAAAEMREDPNPLWRHSILFLSHESNRCSALIQCATEGTSSVEVCEHHQRVCDALEAGTLAELEENLDWEENQ